MLIVPLTVYTPVSDADDEPFRITDFPSYGYILTMADGQVSDVKAYTGSFSDPYVTKNGLEDWSFIDGVGPFNSFYVAINLADTTETCSERRISTAPGQVAYILDPDDLSRTFNGGTYTGSYNIMFVIPTVYWYADGNILYLSNTSGFFGDLTEVGGQQQMKAYAHTVTDTTEGSATTFSYLSIGVYEGSFYGGTGNNAILVSQSGKAPADSRKLDGFRMNAQNNTSTPGSQYGIWNFYQWTLYKMMSYTVMADKNSKEAVGNGVVTSSDPYLMTGLTDSSGFYYGVKGNSSEYRKDSCKLFIENSWGNKWEFIDNTYLDTNRILHAGDALESELSSANVAVSGYDHLDNVQVLNTNNKYSYKYAVSTDSSSWDVPVSHSESDNPSGDGVLTYFLSQPNCVLVGGTKTSNAFGGISLMASFSSLTTSGVATGTRLAYLMTDDAMGVHSITYQDDSNGTVSGITSATEGEWVDLVVQPDSNFRTMQVVYCYKPDMDTIVQENITGEAGFYMPSYSVVVIALFERTVTVTVGTSVNGSVTPQESFVVGIGAEYRVTGNRLGIVDTGGSEHSIIAEPDQSYHFYSFMDQDYNFINFGYFGKDVVIVACFVDWVPVYTVEFFETPSRITELYVEAGKKVMMPEPLAQDGKEFRGWYSSDTWEQSSYVGPQCTYYEPTGSDATVRLYAHFVDRTDVVQSVYPVSCQYILDGGAATQSSSIVDAVFAESISSLSTGVLVITQNAGGHYEHSVTASNATVTKVNGTTWIYSNAAGPVVLTVSSQTVTDRAVEALYIAGVAGDGTGVRVKIDPLTAAGLPSGRVTVKGIVFQNFSNGFVGYANLNVGLGDVTEGQSSYDVTVSDIVEPGFRLYYVYVLLEYGTYDSSTDSYSNEQVSVAIMAPVASL